MFEHSFKRPKRLLYPGIFTEWHPKQKEQQVENFWARSKTLGVDSLSTIVTVN